MTNTGNAISGAISSFMFAIVMAILAYFIYGSTDAALAIFALCYLGGLTALISIIPFIGVFLQYWIYTDYLLPWLFNATGIYATWLTTLLLALHMAVGAFICLMVSALLLLGSGKIWPRSV